MNSALTKPQSLQELYKTYFQFANKFQFTSLLRNYIQNEEWRDKSQQPVWELISRISDDIGAVLTDDIVNYTRNVVDVNTCKVPQLIEHAQMLSYRLDHLKNSYAFFPKRIQCLVDLFSVNQEYLIGNHKNHILSDEVIKEILIYIRDNVQKRVSFVWEDYMDKLLTDPHSLVDERTYRDFVTKLFYTSIVEALSSRYTEDDTAKDQIPIAFNILWKERQDQQNILSRINEYKSWVDKYIWNEIEYPLNDDSGLANTIYDNVQQIKAQKQISSKFNPFKVADHIYFNGFNPNNNLSEDEISLVETVINYHSKTRYDYETQMFVDDMATQYAYYKELEWCEYVKLVMFIVNNIKSFDMTGLTYDISSNKFIQTANNSVDCLRVVKIFNEGGYIVQDSGNHVVINHEIIQMVSKFLCDYVFHIQSIRENMKTIAHKHAMRGSGALLAHIVNDYLIKELPVVKGMLQQQDGRFDDFKFLWETNPEFNNYGNVKILEYEDDNEYFNIDPENDVRFTERTNARYWEQLANMSDDETLGVLTKAQIKNFYRNVLGMGRLQTDKPRSYDDICDFLVDLFKVGANPVKWKSDEEEFYNPIDDIIYDSEEKYGYSKEQRLDVQKNTELRKNQERQFLEYSGNEDVVGNSLYDYVNSKLFYWKNTDYSSHALHPFMYNLKLWNKLNNIIINGYKDYVNTDLISYLSSKTKFDEIFGKYGESRNFWKYNIMDLSGYTTRYEAAIKDEHIDDFNNTTSRLTGYDGLFYPDAAKEFLDLINEDGADFTIPHGFFTNELTQEWLSAKGHGFVAALYSIYWQTQDSFYIKWYSHLNYTRSEYQKIAMQLWYWRDRVEELMTTEYPISKYCLDIQGNSLILVQTFGPEDEGKNPFLVDLVVSQNDIQQNRCGNLNTHVSFCEDKLRRPNEMWIRWKSNPIALPAFDLYYDRKTGDEWFDFYYRKKTNIELGQLTHTNSNCNEWFKIVLTKWRDRYETTVHWNKQLDDGTTVELGNNRLPVFFDMEQSANVLALASWYQTDDINEDGIENRDGYGRTMQAICSGKNPLHILSMERTSTVQSEYTLSEYTQDASLVNPRNMLDWQFDSYKYCQANGSILIPLYRFNCVDEQDFVQKMSVRMFIVPSQSLKQDTFATNDRLIQQDMADIDLNGLKDFGTDYARYRFDHPVKVCRNTNVAFTTYDLNGLNRLKFAFLGTYAMEHDEMAKQQDGKNPDYIGFKVNSCEAKTRYEYDSQSTVDLALTRERYFEESDRDWNKKKNPDGDHYSDRRYIDRRICEDAFNSYDSNDKYVFVLDFEPSIDNTSIFNMSWRNGDSAYAYNILGDAGYIPHFAYQSLIRYGDSTDDRSWHPDGGISFTWKNAYLDKKEHMQFELLGLDDKDIPEEYENMSRMVVDDITDDCKTLICPAKLMDDIYRIWCQNRGVKKNLLPGEEDKYGYKSKYDSYFPNEYKDYANPRLDFNGGDTVEWDISQSCGLRDEHGDLVLEHDNQGRLILFGPNGSLAYEVGEDKYVDPDGNVVEDITGYNPRYVDDGLFELELPSEVESSVIGQQREIDEFRKLLDEYYVYVLRTEKGQILNEKRYLLPPTKLSEFFFCAGGQDGFIKCNISPYQTSLIQDDHFVPTQVVFVGTSNPFRYDNDGERIYTKQEELQYGNGIKGVDYLELGVSIRTEIDTQVLKYDEHGNAIAEERNSSGSSQNGGRVIVTPEYRVAIRKKLVPTLRFKKGSATVSGLLSRVNHEHQVIEPGQVTVVFSHKNIDNIAKYHILNKYSNLYFNGSLPKESQNRNKFKYSDFKYESSVHLRHNATSNRWESVEVGSNGQPILTFNDGDVHGQMQGGRKYPPYYLTGDNGVDPLWFLEQVEMASQSDHVIAKDDVGHHGNNVPGVDGCKSSDDCHASFQENGVTYSVPKDGDFAYAHKVRLFPTKYTDYLYVDRGALSFKISEESESFADAWQIIPPFHIDEVLKNKMKDLNDAQLLKEYSTFIHQSEKPQRVRDCSNFNPLVTNAILKYGLEQKEMQSNENAKVICAEDGRVIELDNHTNFTRLNLQLEDGEIDDCLKIYTNYVRKDDGFGDYHYDLYFNIQNLFHSPFEYISSVTNQPNVLILPDSYLYLPGDKYKQVGDHNEIDSELVDKLQQGGELALYGQVKTYSNNELSDVRTIKLFAYRIYNISDDKPKFLIRKTYDVTKANLQNDIKNNIDIHFSDVMWTVDEEQFVFLDENGEYRMDDQFKVLNRDVIVVQSVDIRYNWNKDDDYRVKQISFDIMNDVIDFDNTPELCEYWMQSRTLRNGDGRLDENGNLVEMGYPYYDHWSDRYMKLEFNPDTGIPRLTLTYDDLDGFNFETIYLKWRLPAGCRVMDTIDRLGGYVFSSTAQNIVADCNNNRITPVFNVRTGYVTARVHKPGELYLGQEHSTRMRKSGYVLTGLLDAINSALKLGKENPTLRDFAISEDEIRSESGLKMDL